MMKKNFATLMLLAAVILMPAKVMAEPTEKQEAKIAYVLKNLKLDAATKGKLKPILAKYYEEVSASKKESKALKEKYASAEEKGKLTPAQCDQLFESKQAQESAELAIRKKYYAQFKTVLSAQKAYQAIKLANDKVK